MLWSRPILRRVHEQGMGDHIVHALTSNKIEFKKSNEIFDCTEREARDFVNSCKDRNVMQQPCTNPGCIIMSNPDSFKTRDAINDMNRGCDVAKALKAELINMSSNRSLDTAARARVTAGDKFDNAIKTLNYAAEHAIACIEHTMAEEDVEPDEFGTKTA